MDDVGEVSADCIFRFFHDEKNKEMIARLKSLGVNMEAEETETIDSAVSGKTVVITGTLPTLGRKEAAELVEKNGGKRQIMLLQERVRAANWQRHRNLESRCSRKQNCLYCLESAQRMENSVANKLDSLFATQIFVSEQNKYLLWQTEI